MSSARPAVEASRQRRWDLFCRVVDNLGDAAVCWRLARQLSREHGAAVRLWIDQPDALKRLVPQARPARTLEGVRIEHWRHDDRRLSVSSPDEVADVVVAGFACALPSGYRTAMVRRRPIWINLEYLSAEDWVDGHHGLPSPKSDGLTEHFFFPGFRPTTGGLLRESDLLAQREAFASDPWARQALLGRLGIEVRPGDRFASIFCYPGSPVRMLRDALLSDTRTGRWRLLVPEGIALDLEDERGIVRIPFLTQPDYDRLLWSCDLNWVRGEDSWVRSLWAARPMVWQAYRQPEDAHRAKLGAFWQHWMTQSAMAPDAAQAWVALNDAWNLAPDPGAGQAVAQALPALLARLDECEAASIRWLNRQGSQTDLAVRLVEFVNSRL